ncbi:hypothetical protein [Specibacter sp. RAF43]|uniref:hypothetical protein n=1 Tax=Specibacter sp. RAF43 TaxID=3233057 RepID=UPI003F979F51
MNGICCRAASGLEDSSRAVDEGVAKIGAKGEQKTETLLNGFAEKTAVLHDLRTPLPGFKANIDRDVDSSRSVLPTDSKMWARRGYHVIVGRQQPPAPAGPGLQTMLAATGRGGAVLRKYSAVNCAYDCT